MTCDPLILAAARTPRGKGSAKGALHSLEPVQLLAHVLERLRAPDVEDVEDVLVGCALPQSANLGREAPLSLGWDVPGVMVNRYCASGLEAIALAASRIRSGDASLLVAGGVESVSRVPMELPSALHMGVSADLAATLDDTSREACDAYAFATRQKAARAPLSPAIVPLAGLDRDENIGYQPTLDELAALPALFGKLGQDPLALTRAPGHTELRHVHTRGNSPSLADAAALVVVGDRGAADRAGLVPRARIVAAASVSADPIEMLTAGQVAIERVLAKANVRAADIAVVEFAEAFAALCVRLMKQLDLGHDRLNPNGGTIAAGHAYGATGAVLAINAVEELERRNGRYAIVAVSGASGVGAAMLLERV